MPLLQPRQYDENLVSQDQIDTLLKGSGEYAFSDGEDPLGDISDFINTDEIDRLLGDDDPEDEDNSEFYREVEMSDEPLPEEEGLEDEDLSMISMDDIQRVLSDETTDEWDDAPLEELNLNMGEIVDASGDDVADGEGDLISQDDIDRLLKNSGVQADEAPEQIDEGFQISREEMETILSDTPEDSPKITGEEPGRDVLPEVNEEVEEPFPEIPPTKKKRLIMAAGFLLLILCAGGGGGFFFLHGRHDVPPVAVAPGSVAGEGIKGTLAPRALGEPQVVSRLDNFLIPALQGDDYTFVSMNLVLTIRGVKNNPFKGCETFFRKRIYDELTAKLTLIKGDKPVQRELMELVRKTSGSILTEGVIDEVVLEDYRLM